MTPQELEEKLKQVFTPEQTVHLLEAFDATRQAEIQRAKDSQELKQGLAALVEAQIRSEERLSRVETRLDRVEAAIEQLIKAQNRTEQQVQALTEAQNRTEQQVQALTVAQTRAEERLARLEKSEQQLTTVQSQLIETVNKMQIRLDRVVGWQLEQRYREKAYAYLGRLLRKVQVISLQEIEEDLQPHLSDQELFDLMPLDLLISGQPRHQPQVPSVWLAVEISAVVDRHDVERAQRRAALLRKAGYPTISAVAGEDVTRGGEEMARDTHTLLLQNGRIQFWSEASAAALAD